MYDFIYYEVRDVVTENPVTIGPEKPLSDAAEIFSRHDFNGLPVVDKDGKLMGMLTKLDILKAFAFDQSRMVPPYAEIMERQVESVMTKDPEFVDLETPLTRVLEEMIKCRYKSLPVVDEDKKVVGMVAREDILLALNRAANGLQPERMT